MIRFACRVSPFRDSGSVSPLACDSTEKVTVAPVEPGKPVSVSVIAKALPALSCQVWKCIVSLGPMLSKIRSTSRLLTC